MFKPKHTALFLIAAAFGLLAMTTTIYSSNYNLDVPEGFPKPPIPKDNQLTDARVKLGRKLFFDPIMSRDKTVSCGTCHRPELAFTDGLKVSQGIEGRKVSRNSPSLGNIAYSKHILRDGIMPDLERQVVVPVQEHEEFDFNVLLIAARMTEDPVYRKLSFEAYGREPDTYVITRAIAAYERTLLTGNSRYDQYKFQGNDSILTESELAGMQLFYSDSLGCGSCHSGHNFSNDKRYNIGLYVNYADTGAARFTRQSSDVGKFKVPSLRNVAITGPYMHDGSIDSLSQVIDFLATGGHNHRNKSELIQPFGISTEEKQNLIDFLEALTDSSFIMAHINDPKLD